MTWAKFDDRYADHPKIDALSDAAFRLHTAAILYCSAYLTDGFVAEDRPPRLSRTYRKASVTELARAGLWEKVEGGWMIHDYLHWNASRAEVQEIIQKQKERGRKGAAARWGTPDPPA